ncbi:DgyrCDS13463 [Dimorphilus gyrociliatus]|uniref:DgyrCDS13463 n=1 Tax=Dimorphilus gyrociliatus TaxID=2664684 RepID=A0A7I8WAQ8_9ANNE|nr:DgyrCDS13463 [Dimorphilus gyrociliatus]
MSFSRGDITLEKLKKKKRKELSEEQKQEIKEAFSMFDGDNDNNIDYYECKTAMKALGFPGKKEEVLKIMKDYDRNNSGKLSFQDFNEVMTDLILQRDPQEEFRKAFQLFDDDGTGSISLRNLRRVARELQETMNDDELRAMIEEFDLNGDGEINYEEFLAIMTGDL